MGRSTLTLPQELLTELVQVTGAKTKTQAVIIAIQDEIRQRKLEQIKGMAGRMEFELEAEALRHRDERSG